MHDNIGVQVWTLARFQSQKATISDNITNNFTPDTWAARWTRKVADNMTTNNKLQSIYEETLKVDSKKAYAIYQAGACGAITTEEVIKQLKQLQPKQEQEQKQKQRSLKCLANDVAKVEMFSLKQALAAVKNTYDLDKDKKDVRAYVESLGFSANTFKAIRWENLRYYVTTKSGRFSTWAVLNALAKYASMRDLKGEQAAKEQRKADRIAAREAKNRIEQARKAEREKKAAEKAAKANAPKSAEVLAIESKVIEKAATKEKTRNEKKSA